MCRAKNLFDHLIISVMHWSFLAQCRDLFMHVWLMWQHVVSVALGITKMEGKKKRNISSLCFASLSVIECDKSPCQPWDELQPLRSHPSIIHTVKGNISHTRLDHECLLPCHASVLEWWVYVVWLELKGSLDMPYLSLSFLTPSVKGLHCSYYAPWSNRLPTQTV